MGFLIVYGGALVVATIVHGTAWWRRLGSRKRSIWLSIGLSMVASLMTAVLLLTAGYIVEGYAVEPLRLGAIYLLMVTPLSLLVAIPFLLLGPRRFGENRCKNCGYDLTRNVSGVCSECGTQVGDR